MSNSCETHCPAFKAFGDDLKYLAATYDASVNCTGPIGKLDIVPLRFQRLRRALGLATTKEVVSYTCNSAKIIEKLVEPPSNYSGYQG